MFNRYPEKLVSKEGDTGSFTLPCLIGPLTVKNALADLGASINLMPHSLFQRLGISKLKPTRMSIQLADRSIKYPIGSQSSWDDFLATARAVIDVHEGKLSLRVRNETVTFNIRKSMKSNPWVSPIQVIPKKGGMTVVKNEKNKFIPQRTVFPDLYRPRRPRKDYVTCPYGTFAYKRMSFGLCNASMTFQRYMTAIFHELIVDNMKVFMDDFFIFGSSFDYCLQNLEKTLKRCEETNLVLNWEKCHFMVKEGIVLGHKVSGSRIEVDKAKIKVISKLPYPTNVKAIWSFLRHAGLYRRFIKDFSQVVRPMTQLLVKDAPFNFYCSLPFEIMCDASDYAVGVVLEKNHSALWYLFTKQDAKPQMIRRILLPQEFDIEIRHKKGAENLVADHISQLENPDLAKLTKAEIRDLFPEEQLMTILNKSNEPWYGVVHRFSTAYNPQTNGQVKNTNWAIKLILEKTIVNNKKEWSHKLDDALWAFRTTFKTPLGTTPFRIIYGKA
nr:hypothetical protein [Tanacetum cinerariifolium]